MKTAKDFRIELHQIPEPSGEERKTKEYILKVLRHNGLEIYEPTKTSVVAYIEANKVKTICFRADMDGLPMIEQTNVSFSSKHYGYMHACGHDGHMAMLLEYAIWANTHKEELAYNIVCLFQHSEEENAGALDIINCGILDKLKVQELYAFHIWPNLERGKLFSMPRAMLASSSEVDIEFFGKGVHAGNRALGIDALEIGASFIQESYQRFANLKEKHLLSFGVFEAGSARNVVAEQATVKATMRSYSKKTYQEMVAILTSLKEKYEITTGIKIKLSIKDLYKSVINDESLFLRAKEKLGILELKESYFQAEDFGCYTRFYPCLFMLLGAGNTSLLHTNTFDFDMDILATGVEAYKTLSKK